MSQHHPASRLIVHPPRPHPSRGSKRLSTDEMELIQIIRQCLRDVEAEEQRQRDERRRQRGR